MRNVFGVKLRLVSGYPGTAEITLAIERGEIDGRCGWSYSSLKQQHPDWVASRQVNILVQLALSRSPELPDVPLIADLAATERQRQILRLVFSRQAMARPFVAPPGIPPEREQALRAAFDETMCDPAFIAEAKQRGLEVNPVGGAEIDKLIEELYQTPADIIAEVRASIAPGAN
jgi:tripartite-type tricarboxylate transporter receptor subunit TctC